MDETVVKRVKLAWGVGGLCVTAFVLVGWGVQAAAVAAVTYIAVSILAFIAFFLYVILGDAPVAWRLLMIALVFVGLFIETGAAAAGLEWLLRGAAG